MESKKTKNYENIIAGVDFEERKYGLGPVIVVKDNNFVPFYLDLRTVKAPIKEGNSAEILF